ncbi:MAG: family 16 glycoside hydrolase, partial [Candidatus Hermodarchaeia archaeon]
ETLFPIGIEYHITIHHNGQSITIFVDDIPIVQYTDYERPYLDGHIGLYCEDSHVHYDNVKLKVK